MLLAIVLPAVAATAKKPVAKKSVAQKRKTVAKTATRKKKVVVARKTVKKGRVRATRAKALPPSKPQLWATEPVSTELKSCSIKEHKALCVNCAEQALSTAMAFTGLRYRRGGTDPNVGFDCSGFVRHVFLNSCGRELPRTAREQFEMGEPVEVEDLQKGDLVFFASRQGWHVGIYTGENYFIHSPNRRESVKRSSLDTPFWKRTYKGARRLTNEIAAPMVAAETSALPANEEQP